MKNANLFLCSLVFTAALSACGGGGSDPVKKSKPGVLPQTPAIKPAQPSPTTPKPVLSSQLINPACAVVMHSGDPAYLNCLHGLYSGKNPAGEDCSLHYQGTTSAVTYTLGEQKITFPAGSFTDSLYNRAKTAGDLLMTFLDYKKGEIVFKFSTPEHPGAANVIEVKYKASNQSQIESSCRIQHVQR